MKRYKQKYKESSLSRLVKHMDEHQTGTVSAYRSRYSRKENKQRNKSLKAELMSFGYGITEVQGIFIENYNTPDAIEVKEQVFFVTDLNDRRDLEKRLRRLGEDWEQDSILYIPKKGETSFLWGTNKNNNYPRYGEFMEFPVRKFGTDDHAFLTKVRGRPFYFKESIIREEYCGNISGRYVASLEAKKDWRTL